MSIRVLLVDDHHMFREGVRNLLGDCLKIEVVAEASNGRQALEQVETSHPDVVIMDIGMPGLNGIDAARQIHDRWPETKVIALSMHADRRFVANMLRAGAAGYLLKDCAFEELVCAIRAVAENRVYLSPYVADVVVDDYKRRLAADQQYAELLTPREREVLQLLAEGQSTKRIASMLHVSIKTIETHRRQLMNKTGVSSIAELTKFAIRRGLTSADD